MSLRALVSAVAVVVLHGCASSRVDLATPNDRRPDPSEPSLDVLAKAEPPAGHRALLVVYPRSACSGSARAVFTDPNGTFLGAVAPGEGALLVVPSTERTILAFSSVEVATTPSAWSTVDEVTMDPAPSGLVVRTRRVNARQCGNGQYMDVEVASKTEIEHVLGESELRWVTPNRAEGAAWLAAHRDRVVALLGLPPAAEQKVVTRVRVP